MAASGIVLKPSSPEDLRTATSPQELEATVPVKKPFWIFLDMMGTEGATVPIELLRFDTIVSIKLRLQSQEDFFSAQHRVMYGGQELSPDELLIKDYGVTKDEVLHLMLRVSDFVAVTVKTVNGEKHVFQGQKSLRIGDFKKCIFSKQGRLALEQQLLTLKGKQLADGTAIQDLPLGDFVLHLYVQKPTKPRIKRVGEVLELLVTATRFDAWTSCTEKLSASPKDDQVNNISRFPLKKDTHQLFHASLGKDVVRHYSSIEPARHCQRLEIPDILKDLLEQVKSGLQAGRVPSLSSEGSGGVYFMKDEYGLENVGVFKPMDEEPMAVNNPRGFSSSGCNEGLRRGTRVGAGALREVAAYLLDHSVHGSRQWKDKYTGGFAGVPPTMMVRCYHKTFHWNAEEQRLYRQAKLGSLQQFVHAFSSCEDMGTSSFPVEEVHKITVLDLRLANTDRNGGNILVCRGEEQLKLVPIDHGYCLPEKFEDCTFEWLYWPQAHHPYGSSTLKYIASLDAEQDIKLLQQYGLNLHPQSARVLRVSTMVLKKGAAAHLVPFQIGSIISRQFPDLKSPIEVLMEEAEFKKPPGSGETGFLQALHELIDHYIATMKP